MRQSYQHRRSNVELLLVLGDEDVYFDEVLVVLVFDLTKYVSHPLELTLSTRHPHKVQLPQHNSIGIFSIIIFFTAFSTLLLKPSFSQSLSLQSRLYLAQTHLLELTTRCLAVTGGGIVLVRVAGFWAHYNVLILSHYHHHNGIYTYIAPLHN